MQVISQMFSWVISDKERRELRHHNAMGQSKSIVRSFTLSAAFSKGSRLIRRTIETSEIDFSEQNAIARIIKFL